VEFDVFDVDFPAIDTDRGWSRIVRAPLSLTIRCQQPAGFLPFLKMMIRIATRGNGYMRGKR
jgi:hypothetical protein